MRKWVVLLLLTLLSLAACGRNRAGVPPETGPEAFFSANLQRTGVYDSAPVTQPAASLWQFTTGDWVVGAPAAVEGLVYFGSYDGNFYAADAATGAEKWRFATGNPVIASPAVSGDLVFIGTLDGNLYALNRVTGEEVWRFATRGGITASTAVANGLAYVGSEDGNLYAINVNDGQEAWHVATGAPISFEAALSGDLLLVGNGAGVLTAVKAINGEKVWDLALEDSSLTAGPVVGDGLVFLIVSRDLVGELVAVDLTGQQERWRYRLPLESFASPAVWEGLVYVAGLDGVLYATVGITAVIKTARIKRRSLRGKWSPLRRGGSGYG
jgi:outer membrane protein assembly factor BamB